MLHRSRLAPDVELKSGSGTGEMVDADGGGVKCAGSMATSSNDGLMCKAALNPRIHIYIYIEG